MIRKLLNIKSCKQQFNENHGEQVKMIILSKSALEEDMENIQSSS